MLGANKRGIYVPCVLRIWFRRSVCPQLRMNFSTDSDIALDSKAKCETIIPVYKHQYWYFPWITCQLSFLTLNPETAWWNTLDKTECSDSGARATVCHVNTKPQMGETPLAATPPTPTTNQMAYFRVYWVRFCDTIAGGYYFKPSCKLAHGSEVNGFLREKSCKEHCHCTSRQLHIYMVQAYFVFWK